MIVRGHLSCGTTAVNNGRLCREMLLAAAALTGQKGYRFFWAANHDCGGNSTGESVFKRNNQMNRIFYFLTPL